MKFHNWKELWPQFMSCHVIMSVSSLRHVFWMINRQSTVSESIQGEIIARILNICRLDPRRFTLNYDEVFFLFTSIRMTLRHSIMLQLLHLRSASSYKISAKTFLLKCLPALSSLMSVDENAEKQANWYWTRLLITPAWCICCNNRRRW